MFRGDDRRLTQVMVGASAAARHLGRPRVGSEHLLLALAQHGGLIAEVLRRHHVAVPEVEAALAAAPWGAGAAADGTLLGEVGVDLDRILDAFGPGWLDRPTGRHPRFPLGSGRARRRCARMKPPLGLDAQAAYEAGLRLALARRERWYGPDDLVQALVVLDPGVAWVLAMVGADRRRLLDDLAVSFPPPALGRPRQAWRRLCAGSRGRELVYRYEIVVGHRAVDMKPIVHVITG